MIKSWVSQTYFSGLGFVGLRPDTLVSVLQSSMICCLTRKGSRESRPARLDPGDGYGGWDSFGWLTRLLFHWDSPKAMFSVKEDGLSSLSCFPACKIMLWRHKMLSFKSKKKHLGLFTLESFCTFLPWMVLPSSLKSNLDPLLKITTWQSSHPGLLIPSHFSSFFLVTNVHL